MFVTLGDEVENQAGWDGGFAWREADNALTKREPRLRQSFRSPVSVFDGEWNGGNGMQSATARRSNRGLPDPGRFIYELK